MNCGHHYHWHNKYLRNDIGITGDGMVMKQEQRMGEILEGIPVIGKANSIIGSELSNLITS